MVADRFTEAGQEGTPPARPSAAPISDQCVNTAGSNSIVLIVEDDPTIRVAIAEMLKAAGLVPLAASSGREAVNLFIASAATVEAVLLDLSLPDMSGLDVCHALWDIRPRLPVLMMSGYAQEEIAFPAGMHRFAFLQKPFGPAQLVRKLTTLLRGRNEDRG